MFKKLKSATKHVVCVIATMSSLCLSAQTNQKLRIGDQAPQLKYSKWIKGTPINAFSGDHLYIMEFWATWCGPCKAAMPHLTKLQKEYEGKATFIGANVWEKIKQEQPYESVVPNIEKFVEGNKANMGYNVIVDNNEQHLGNNWLKAAGINGIPSTFVIKNNQILWIGHPMALDSVMPLILTGKYDMKAYAAAYYKAEATSTGQQLTSVMSPIDEAVKAKDYPKALELVNKALMVNHSAQMLLERAKFQVLLNVDEAKALKQAEVVIKLVPQSGPGVIATDIYNNDKLSASTYLFGAKVTEDLIPNITWTVNPMMYDVLAALYFRGGNMEKAITSEQKAIDLLKGMAEDQASGMVGMSKADKLKEFEKQLEIYKKAVKK